MATTIDQIVYVSQTVRQTAERRLNFGMQEVLLSYILITMKLQRGDIGSTSHKGVFRYRQLGLSHDFIAAMSPPVYFGCQIGLRTNRFPSYNTIPRYGSRLAFEVFMCSHKSQVECIIGTINRGLRLRQKLLIDSLQSYKYDMRQSKSRKELAPNTPPKIIIIIITTIIIIVAIVTRSATLTRDFLIKFSEKRKYFKYMSIAGLPSREFISAN